MRPTGENIDFHSHLNIVTVCLVYVLFVIFVITVMPHLQPALETGLGYSGSLTAHV